MTTKRTLINAYRIFRSPRQSPRDFERRNMKRENMSYKIILTAPDGRFGTTILEGGYTLKTAKIEAKRQKDVGHIVKLFDKENKRFVNF